MMNPTNMTDAVRRLHLEMQQKEAELHKIDESIRTAEAEVQTVTAGIRDKENKIKELQNEISADKRKLLEKKNAVKRMPQQKINIQRELDSFRAELKTFDVKK